MEDEFVGPGNEPVFAVGVGVARVVAADFAQERVGDGTDIEGVGVDDHVFEFDAEFLEESDLERVRAAHWVVLSG
jgi:hypothetical protein